MELCTVNEFPCVVGKQALVVLPTYNEKENLNAVVTQILEQSDQIAVLVVDDQSPDGTGTLADHLVLSHPGDVFVLHRKTQRGRGLAGVDGFRWACRQDVSFVLEMDADLSHPPEFLNRLLEAASGVDMVIGSRYIKGGKVVGWGLRRHIQSRVANALTRLMLGIRVHDATSGYRCFQRAALNGVIWGEYLSEGPSIVEEILIRLLDQGCTFREIPITFVERQKGKSKVSLPLIVRWIKTLWKIARSRKRL